MATTRKQKPDQFTGERTAALVAGAVPALATAGIGTLNQFGIQLAPWLWAIYGVGSASLLLVCVVLSMHLGWKAGLRRGWSILLVMAFQVIALLSISAFLGFSYKYGLIWPREKEPATLLFKQQVPGFSAHLVIRLADIQKKRRKYIGTFSNSAGAKAALYISASDRFAVTFTDTNGEPYTLEAVAGRKGIPIAEWVYLASEAGASRGITRMQLRVNGDVVADRVFPFEIDLGKPDWRVETLGGNADGKENGGFGLGELVLYGRTMDEKTQGQINGAVAAEWKIR